MSKTHTLILGINGDDHTQLVDSISRIAIRQPGLLSTLKVGDIERLSLDHNAKGKRELYVRERSQYSFRHYLHHQATIELTYNSETSSWPISDLRYLELFVMDDER